MSFDINNADNWKRSGIIDYTSQDHYDEVETIKNLRLGLERCLHMDI